MIMKRILQLSFLASLLASIPNWALSQVNNEDALGNSESLDEVLYLRPVGEGRLSAHFEFIIRSNQTLPLSSPFVQTDERHYTLFPLALGQILLRHEVTEMHLTLNSGKWDYESWGFPPYDSVGSGADLWAWMPAESQTDIKDRWKGLTNGLSGLLCASLGSLDEKRTVSPDFALRPEGNLPPGAKNALLYAPLPSESVCTENLTPFIKLLPCKSHSGIAMLLNPHRIFDADWHGVGVHVRWVENVGVELRLTVTTILDPARVSPLLGRDWSFGSSFDRVITRSCSVATRSYIEVKLPYGQPYALTPAPDDSLTTTDGIVRYDLRDLQGPLNVAMQRPEGFRHTKDTPYQFPLLARRQLQGGQAYGKLIVDIRNYRNETVVVQWLETMPWFISYYLHTLKATLNGLQQPNIDEVVDILTYVPPSQKHPLLVEANVKLPPQSHLNLEIGLSKASIAYTDHPPDASRGWDLPPAVFSLMDGDRIRRLYTNILLGDLATPDFSMPYNVIIMTSTLAALFFGSIFNVLTRSFIWVRVALMEDKVKIE